MANVFLLHLVILFQNVYITMLIYAEGKGSLKKINGLTVVLSQLASSWELMDIILTINLKQKFRLLTLTICYMRVDWKLGLELEGSFVVSNAPVWK